MWYVTRKADNKEFMLVSANSVGITGVANDGEKAFIVDGQWSSMIKK